MATATREPETRVGNDPLWGIEQNGINPIPDAERHGGPLELFWIWTAANISVLAIWYGSVAVSNGLNLWQGILAALVATSVSFLLVGLVSLAGKRAGAPTWVLSRAPFGVIGNAFPNLTSYLSLVGWETYLVAFSALTVEALFARLGWPTGRGLLAISFVLIAALIIAIGLLGHATIARIQTWFTWAFAALTIIFVILEIPKIDGSKVTALHAGPWGSGWLATTSILMAGLGLSWANSGADYSRYLPRNVRSRSVVWWTTFGGSLAPFLLIVFGVLLSAKNPSGLNSAPNPISYLAIDLPTWFVVPYLVVAVGGLVAGAVLDIYSSGLNLLTLGVRLPRYQSVVIDGTIMIIGNIYILFFAGSFIGPFVAFLLVLGVPLTAWVAVFLVDMLFFRRDGYQEEELYNFRSGPYFYLNGFNPRAIIAWFVAVIVGLGLTTTSVGWLSWLGWWAKGNSTLATSNIGLLVAFVVGAGLFWLLNLVPMPGTVQPAAASRGTNPSASSE
jgi:NCS1 family nucleobase:cation symporter-1